MSLLMLMKSQPLAYNKDNQEDKEPLFDTADTLINCLRAYADMVPHLSAKKANMYNSAKRGFATATDLADWLVRKASLTFREAHHVAGRLVRLAESKGVRLKDLPLAEMRAIEPKLTRAVYRVLDVAASAASRRSEGGTAPERVRAAVKDAKRRFTS